MICHIKENSFVARIAAWKLGADKVAIVIGRTIHLYNTNKQEFLQSPLWVRHELAHVKQFNHHGFLPFIFKYIIESMKNGYRNNKYEVEARNAEQDQDIGKGIEIV